MVAEAAVIRDPRPCASVAKTPARSRKPLRTGADVVWIFTITRPRHAAPRRAQVHPSHLRTSTPTDARLRPFVCALTDLLVADVLRYPNLNRCHR
jgi:hypothetical protein